MRLAWYATAFLAGLAFPLLGYRCDLCSLNAPLVHEPVREMYNDMYLILPMVQSTLDGGTHWTTPRLGAPGIQTQYDFPVIDHLHFLGIWILGQFLGSAVVVFNVYYLLTYPLAAVVMMAVLRHFGVSFASSFSAGIFFAALPYHQYRGVNHYFLSAYFMVPVGCLYMLELCRGRFPGFDNPARRFVLFDKFTFVAILAMMAISAAGAYYAFFTCGLLASAGLYAAVTFRTWRAVISATLLISVVTAGGVANHLPAFLHQAEFGKHPSPIERFPEDSEYYGLKFAQLLLPIDDHNIRVVSDFKSIYNSYLRPSQSYSERYSLGTVAAVGFVILVARMLLMLPRRWPYSELAVLTMFAVVIGTVGGLGAIFNQTITPAVRCYNRIAVFIAVFSLFAIATLGDDLIAWIRRKNLPAWMKRCIPLLLWGPVLTLGLVDMTPYEWGTLKRAREVNTHQSRWFTDAVYFAEIEQVMNPDGVSPGPAVFQLPYIPWPEASSINNLGAYELSRGYLHTKTLRWSFGSIKGRETDEWYRSVAAMTPFAIAPMLDRIALAGFEGLLLDKRGYSPAQADFLEQQLLKTISGADPIRHPDGQQLFFDLRRHNQDIRQGRDWDAEKYRETHRPVILWLEGFVSYKEPGYEWQRRWCSPRGTAIFVNPTNETKSYTCTFRLHTEFKDPAELSINGGSVWTEQLTIDTNSPEITRTFAIPPGRHAVKFKCIPPISHIPTEHRRLTFLISGLKLD